jgi:hypothetical protein
MKESEEQAAEVADRKRMSLRIEERLQKQVFHTTTSKTTHLFFYDGRQGTIDTPIVMRCGKDSLISLILPLTLQGKSADKHPQGTGTTEKNSRLLNRSVIDPYWSLTRALLEPYQRTQIGMFRPIRLDHTNCLQVAIKTHSSATT